MNDMSILDWERQFRKVNTGQNKFPINQAIFIKVLGKVGPVDFKPDLKKQMLDSGLTEEEYLNVYEELKQMHVMKYNISEPRGWYIEPSALDRINAEYPEPIKKESKEDKESQKKNSTKNSTIDVFIEPKKDKAKKSEDVIEIEKENTKNQEPEAELSPNELKKLMKEWEKENL
jgi:hypothetical protein